MNTLRWRSTDSLISRRDTRRRTVPSGATSSTVSAGEFSGCAAGGGFTPMCLPLGMAKNTLSTDDARDQHGNPAGVLEQANDVFDDMVTLRRDLHRWPEISNHLPRTRERVLESLQGLPLDITLHENTSGIAAMLTGGNPGPTVLLRADMDALPMPEDTDVAFKSQVENAMHACGHDTHAAMLMGAAKILSARQADIPGRVLFMFQPGEEGYNGASEMLAEGLLDVGTDSPVTGAFAIHAASNIPGGFLGLKGGTIMASSDSMTITVKGRGGHGSGLRDRPGAADTGDETHRRVRPGRHHRHPDSHGHHQQRHPRDRHDQRHHARRQRAHPHAHPRRTPPRRRGNRRGARHGGRGGPAHRLRRHRERRR
ncbi:MAG: amidohydrolase, partial [Actinobacteria bacterium]|nr:amidohydrolase [Actinomycetota bacterium]